MAKIQRPLDARFVWSGILPCKHLLPVNLSEERVRHNCLWILETLTWILHEKLVQEVSCHSVVVLLKLNFVFADVSEKDLLIRVIKRWQARNHLIEDDAEAPPVASKSILALAFKNFRCKVLGSTDEAPCLLTACHVFFR